MRKTYDVVEAAETVQPPVGSGKVVYAQPMTDAPGLVLHHWSGDVDTGGLLGLVPVPHLGVDLLVARPPGSALPPADVRIGFRPFLLPLLEVGILLAQDVEDLSLAASKLWKGGLWSNRLE